MNFTETKIKYHRPFNYEFMAQTRQSVRIHVSRELDEDIADQAWAETWYEVWVKVNYT